MLKVCISWKFDPSLVTGEMLNIISEQVNMFSARDSVVNSNELKLMGKDMVIIWFVIEVSTPWYEMLLLLITEML